MKRIIVRFRKMLDRPNTYQPVYCGECGAANPPSANYCSACGKMMNP